MTVILQSITPEALALKIAAADKITILDVRRASARASDGAGIAGALWRDPATWLDWKDSIAKDTPIVVYCAKGHEISQAMTAMLQAFGAQVSFLEGGYAAWCGAGLAVQVHAAVQP